MIRFFLSLIHEAWWRFCLKQGHPSYTHARWRIWQAREYRRQWLRD